jgi:hypothetical protein
MFIFVSGLILKNERHDTASIQHSTFRPTGQVVILCFESDFGSGESAGFTSGNLSQSLDLA